MECGWLSIDQLVTGWKCTRTVKGQRPRSDIYTWIVVAGLLWSRWEGRLGDRKGNSVASPRSLVFNRRKGRSAEENEGK